MVKDIKEKDMREKEKRVLIYSSLGFILAFAGTVYFISRRKENSTPLDVVPQVDLNRYSGEWFEIARFPAFFERDCKKTKANYTLNDDGSMKVINSCQTGEASSGKLKKAEAKAYSTDPSNAKLKINFWGGFVKGDYQIIALDDDYQFAMVGTPDRKRLWILSRAPQLETRVMADLLEKATSQGFDISKLIFTHHN